VCRPLLIHRRTSQKTHELAATMRLINTSNFAFEEVTDEIIPPYAILSHTWGEGEVTFLDMSAGISSASLKPGFIKIKYCCEEACRDGLPYAWVDTCCIDKSSSAELSEAINSMFRWYQQSKICYVYLSDFVDSEVEPAFFNEFAKCRWFTRGWTLQELLAPSAVKFFNMKWTFIGSRSDLSIALSKTTRIGEEIIEGHLPISSASVACRMSWAATRTTTRIEDMAYSLLGIFEINMPLLYGEGHRAFLRLQEEIIKESQDQSIFAWQPLDKTKNYYGGVLAKHPRFFRESGNIVPHRAQGDPFSMTNKGIRIQLPIIDQHDPLHRFDSGIAVLDCHYENCFSHSLGIRLKLFGSDRSNKFGRYLTELRNIAVNTPLRMPKTVYLAKDSFNLNLKRIQKCWLRRVPSDYELKTIAPPELPFDSKNRILILSNENTETRTSYALEISLKPPPLADHGRHVAAVINFANEGEVLAVTLLRRIMLPSFDGSMRDSAKLRLGKNIVQALLTGEIVFGEKLWVLDVWVEAAGILDEALRVELKLMRLRFHTANNNFYFRAFKSIF
jgi:hypothetical protein